MAKPSFTFHFVLYFTFAPIKREKNFKHQKKKIKDFNVEDIISFGEVIVVLFY